MDPRIRTLTRALHFGAPVVWDALIDPVLVQGWLAPEARPVVGAPLAVSVDGVPLPGASAGRLSSLEPGRVALLDLGPAGSVRFEVEAEPPAPTGRGRSTVRVVAEPAHDLAAVGLTAALQARLDALEQLLRGRPVAWSAAAPADGAASLRGDAGGALVEPPGLD